MRTYRDRQRSLEQIALHLEVWAEELSAWEIAKRIPISGWLLTAPEGEERTVKVGDSWSHRTGIHTFQSGQVTVPEGEGMPELRLAFGGEALVRLLGADGNQLDAFGANPYHKRFAPIPAEPFTIHAEVAARNLFGEPNREPKLEMAELAFIHPIVRDLRRRVEIVHGTIESVSDNELARALCEVTEEALSHLRLPTETDQIGPRLADQSWAQRIWERSYAPTNEPAPLTDEALASIATAIKILDEGLAGLRQGYPKQGKVLATGHAHIDYVWLWPQEETIRKILRTFNSVNSLMKSHREFRFLQSSSLFYEHVEQEEPELFDAIKARVAEGQWEVNGGMFIECDTNLPSGEAFVRQFLYGQRYFEDRFGTINRIAWLPDTFGFTGAMPQIMTHMGIETLITIKVSWNETNALPETIFHWQGNDGSKVLVHTFNAINNEGYNMKMRPQALQEVWQKHTSKDLKDTVIASYGWGDGGGGPDPDQIETMPLLNLMPAIPTVEHGNIQTHIDTLQDELKDANVPVWTGEMYLEYHRATLTTQARTKQLNRRAEYALVANEAVHVLGALAGAEVTMPALDDDWKFLLRNQFHDILPGSSIREAYVQTEEELEGVVTRSEAAISESLDTIARRKSGKIDGALVANISGSAKKNWQLISKSPLPNALNPQTVGDTFVTTSNHALKPISLTFASSTESNGVTVSQQALENDLVKVELDQMGRVISMFDKRHGKELVDGAANKLMVYRNDLPRKYDAWDIEPGFELSGEELTTFDHIKVTANGPHLGEITITRKLGASTIVQKLRLWANSPRLEFVTDIDWHDRRTYVRAVFPVNVHAEQATYDQAIGVTKRATHNNTTWQKAQFEACGHRFVSLEEAGWGAAILSADKYGFSAKDNVMTISLVRGPMFPDMLADEGQHHFTYALMPHDGRWWSEEVQAEADLVSDPLRHCLASADEDYTIAPVAWEGLDLKLHALKPLEEKDGYLLRTSEVAGARGTADFALPEEQKGQLADGLERPIENAELSAFKPFQMKSIRF